MTTDSNGAVYLASDRHARAGSRKSLPSPKQRQSPAARGLQWTPSMKSPSSLTPRHRQQWLEVPPSRPSVRKLTRPRNVRPRSAPAQQRPGASAGTPEAQHCNPAAHRSMGRPTSARPPALCQDASEQAGADGAETCTMIAAMSVSCKLEDLGARRQAFIQGLMRVDRLLATAVDPAVGINEDNTIHATVHHTGRVCMDVPAPCNVFGVSLVDLAIALCKSPIMH